MITDPTTNTVLSSKWKSPIDMPAYPKASDPSFVCLVLIDNEGNSYDKPIVKRIHVASFNENISTIGGMFSFDCPDIIAWQELPTISLANEVLGE